MHGDCAANHAIEEAVRQSPSQIRGDDAEQAFLPMAENHLERGFRSTESNRKLVTDIICIRTAEGEAVFGRGHWIFYSRRIVKWSMSKRIDAELTCSALNMAIRSRQPESGFLHHSDRGVQYASYAYQSP